MHTPTFRINGFVDPTLSSQTNLSQWINYIDTIFNQKKRGSEL
jgi:hypothetical protein